MRLRSLICLVGLGVPSCSAPQQTAPISQGTERSPSPAASPTDSLPHYFPAEATELPTGTKTTYDEAALPPEVRGCRWQYQYAMECLTAFSAPALPGSSPGAARCYRFIWLRSFHRPALLTLQCTATGGVLQTQFLTKPPGMSVPVLGGADTTQLTAAGRAEERASLRRMRADSTFMQRFRAKVAFAKAPVRVAVANSVLLTAAQLTQFEQQLRQAAFWQLPSCQPDPGMTDGAYWFLEGRAAGRYHVVYRHSPPKNNNFRRCCELLLDWSPARREERY